ncbi:MAG: hypothetical protein JJ992_08485 [Planctomycetes bacterium]|nr:hypothetical protein [Planctomycetota bacterium]
MIPNVLEKLPAQSYEEGQRLASELISGGPDAVKKLVGMVGDRFGDADSAKPKMALHGMVLHATRPGAIRERKMVAAALAAELCAEHSDELKAFICRQLQFCAHCDEVPALATLLNSDRLCEPAVQVLLAINSEAALNALQQALPDAKGARQVTLRQAADIISGR